MGALLGWGNGTLAQLAAGIAFPGGGYGGFRTPNTFPDGSGSGGVSDFVAKKKKKQPKPPTKYNPAKVAKFIDQYVFLVKGAPNIFQNSPLNETIENENISGLDDRIIKCQAAAESNYKADAVGGAKEVGLLQVKPATARGMGYDPASLNDAATGKLECKIILVF
jgi:hypothetical protein